MTSTASLHFGPEWMRTKPARAVPASPVPNGNGANPLATTTTTHNGSAAVPPPSASFAHNLPSHSSYSSLLASPMPADSVQDVSNPFRYSRDQMLAVWKHGGGQGDLGLEVERWPGIVREVAGEPLGLTELSMDEKKAFSMPYNSDPPTIRRRGDSYSSQTPTITTAGGGLDSLRDRNKLASPIRPFGGGNVTGNAGAPASSVGLGLPGRRKKDENGQDIPLYRPRQLSLGTSGNPSSTMPPSPGALPSPGVNGGTTRPRLGGAPFDGVMGDAWGGAARRRVSEPRVNVLNTGRAVDEKLEGSWRPGADHRFRDEIAEEPTPESWEAESKDSNPVGESVNGFGADRDSGRASVPISDSSVLSAPTAPPPPPPDSFIPENISWCYKDPSGQVQGPFTAALMQSWFVGGYFADDLLLKRLEVDQEFDPLQAYKGRVIPPGTADNLFLHHIAAKAPAIPPGLVGVGRVSPPSSGVPPQTAFGQPQNQYSRNDVYPSTSPATGPSPSIANAAAVSNYTSPSMTSSGFATTSVIGGGITDAEKQRQEREEFLQSLREKELASNTQTGINGFGQGYGSGADLGSMGAGMTSNLYHNAPHESTFHTGLTPIAEPHSFSASSPLSAFSNQQQPFPSSINTAFPSQNQLGGMGQLYSPSSLQQQAQNSIWPRTPQTGLSDHMGVGFGNVHNPSGQTFNSSPWHSIIEPSSNMPFDSTPSYLNVNQAQSPWNNTQMTSMEPVMGGGIPSMASGQFNQANNPSIGHLPTSQMEPFPERTVAAPQPEPERPSEFVDQSQQPDGDVGQTLAEGLDALAIDNEVELAQPASATPDPTDPVSDIPKVSKSAIKASAATQLPTPARSRTTTSSSAAPPLRIANIAPEAFPVVGTESAATPSPSTAPKTTVWSNFPVDEKNTSAMSLRKIQEVEAKRAADAKKLEKEKERSTKALASTSTASPVTSIPDTAASWGLPQVGRAPPSVPTPISLPGSSPAAAGAWATKPAKVTKKTMKEIQEEEEEKRKREALLQPQAREPAAVPSAPAISTSAAKRAYAESAKTSSPASALPASGWTTVVAGKVTKPPGTVPAVPVAAPVVRPTGIAALPPRPSTMAMPPSTSTSASASSMKPKQPAAQKPAEDTPPPSLDFIRWMRDALRGLTGANVDEFMQMLLSFPLDPPPTVMEIISDSVYASSATLDGRRFATEFVAKRKADAANAKAYDAKQAGLFAGRVSLADVVKTQKKVADDGEWSVKPVKAKGKKNRGGTN